MYHDWLIYMGSLPISEEKEEEWMGRSQGQGLGESREGGENMIGLEKIANRKNTQ